MKTEFKIDNSIALEVNGIYIDLHNFYHLHDLNIEIPYNRITLRWEKSEKWISEKSPETCEIVFSSVSFFQMSEHFYMEHPTNLEEIGFKEPDNFDHDWLGAQEHSNEKDHIFFRFRGDEFLRIYAKKAFIDLRTSDKK
ncbi:hypothetical protein [uncultured Arcticibacterium sp.]|uniref:hypothetical protein n=1 Tax=uncultured Arcticibacterium sp. TaxID=2173042 RepID=UPI0030F936D5